MHIHSLDPKCTSRSPICFNELGSWGERLNFSSQFQTEKVKRALLCQREEERGVVMMEEGRRRGGKGESDGASAATGNLLPGSIQRNVPLFSADHSLHCKQTHTSGPEMVLFWFNNLHYVLCCAGN